jgi:hypothetical protein
VKRESELQANLAAYQVWRLAHMMRLKRLPRKPDDLTTKKRPGSTGENWKMQKAAIEMFSAAIGGYDNRRSGDEGMGA